MAEAELRRETEIMFQDMGMPDLPPDTLDFFQRNLENGSSSEWKRSLKVPSSSRPRRTSSDGTALVHLKKKYSTGLNPDYHSKRNTAIAVLNSKSADGNGVDNNSTSQELSTKKVHPSAGGLGSRFGYTGKTSSNSIKVSAPVNDNKRPSQEEAASTATTETSTHSQAEKSMFKRRTSKSSATESPADPIPSGGSNVTARRLMHTSSAGSIRPPAPMGSIAADKDGGRGSSNHESRHRFGPNSAARRPESSAAVVNGVHPPMQTSGAQELGSNLHTHSSPKTTSANTTTSSSICSGDTHSSVHNSINSLKLSGVNMRSLTKTTESRKTSDRRNSSERKPLDSDNKPSFIPIPAPVGRVSKIPVAKPEDATGNTQVLYSRKSSFKVVNVSSSSHRIMHTVQDGGVPKRYNSVKGPRPLSLVTGSSSSHSHTGTNTITSPLAGQSLEMNHVSLAPPKLEKQVQRPLSLGKVNGSLDCDALVSLSVHGDSDLHTANANSTSQIKREGAYDRLSPPVENPTSKKEEPVYETIKDGVASPQHTKDDLPVTENHDTSSTKPKDSLSSNVHDQLNDAMSSVVNTNETSDPNPTQSLKPVSSRSNPIEDSFESKQAVECSTTEKPALPLKRYSSELGSIYTAVDKTKLPLPSSQERGSADLEADDTNKSSSTRKILTHKALCPSLSDSSTESRRLRIPESLGESGVNHFHSSAFAFVHAAEPASEQEKDQGQTTAEVDLNAAERKAKLEVDWSQISLNQNMKEVATSTVAALSTLMEVLATPSKPTDQKFMFDR